MGQPLSATGGLSRLVIERLLKNERTVDAKGWNAASDPGPTLAALD
jgi:hypothetical protein